MRKKQFYSERELAALAKRFRLAAGKNRSEAARELGVARPSLIHAEDFPEKTFIKLRCRMIALYSPFKVSGPLYLLEKK
jgi:DNA-binding XRE family transcriptional regulator